MRLSQSAFFRSRRSLVFLSGVLLVLIVVHNILDIGTLFDSSWLVDVETISPWGVFLLLCFLLFYVSEVEKQGDGRELERNVFWIVTLFSLVISVSMALIYAGFLEGNTSKFFEAQMGGFGLGGRSTNETAFLAIVLILWNIRFMNSGQLGRKTLPLLSIVLMSSVVVLTQSRTSLILLGIIFLLMVFTAKVSPSRRIALVIPLVVVFSIAGYQVIMSRFAADAIETPMRATIAPFGVLSGSGRGVLWYFLLEGFLNRVAENAFALFTGIGDVGLIRVFYESPLPALGFVTPVQGAILPPHSDFIRMFISTGLFGALAFLGILVVLVRLKKKVGQNAEALVALLSLTIAVMIDMTTYNHAALCLLFLFVATSIDYEGNVARSAVT